MVNPRKKRMIMPDIMLDTKNVMIPVIRPVPVKQSLNVSFNIPENRAQILRAPRYKNNPALLFFETPSHALYNPLRNLVEVKKLDGMKVKNQNTKYTISGRADPASTKETNPSQNSYPSKGLSCRETDRTLCFPNTVPMYSETSRNDRSLHAASSRSIELSRKCNLPQIEQVNQVENKLANISQIETEFSNNNMSESPIASLASQSLYDYITDTASTISVSVSNCKIENKEAFAGTRNREGSVSKTGSNQLQSINSECEINVLHYENDTLSPPEDCSAHFVRHLQSVETKSDYSNAAKTRNDNNNNVTVEENRMENWYYECNANKIPKIKYSWEIDNWISHRKLLSHRREYNDIYGTENIDIYSKKPYECKIKYSWQVIGISTQTSCSLLQDLLDDMEIDKSAQKLCSVKYSWQIIGIGTQASLNDCNDSDYWKGMLLSPNKNCDKNNFQIGNIDTVSLKLRDHVKCAERGLRRCLILNNQETQTCAEKEIQTDANAKYSWHNLIKRYM